MAPEFATVFSAIIAITSVSINLYGGLITEKRRAELAREVERERQALAAAEEERSVVARYRGPLLEATADLEARIYHIATLSGEWRSGEVVCEEEVVYTLFTLAQWLGFLEVIRREGPRERSFLQRSGGTGNTSGGGAAAGAAAASQGGTDTLTTLVEGFRFVMSAHPATLRKWYEQGDDRDHPGLRSRRLMLQGTPAMQAHAMRAAAVAAATARGGGGLPHLPPVPETDWAAVSAAAAAAAASGSSPGISSSGSSSSVYGSSSSNGRAEPAGPSQEQQPRWRGAWVGMANGSVGAGGGPALPPPPTQPVMLLPAGFNAQQPGPAGRAPPYGAAGGSELVIGSLDEMSLEEAGFSIDGSGSISASPASSSSPSSPYGPAQQPQQQQPQQSPLPGAAPRYPPPEPTALTVPPPPSAAGPPPSAGGNALAAAMMFADFGPSLASLSSLSSIDEGSFAFGSFGGAAAYGGLDGLGAGGGSKAAAAAAAAGGSSREGYETAGGRLSAPRDVFHMSRGTQRSIGSMMVVTPMGAKRHYTLSYGDFYNRYYLDPVFASWLRPVHTDILALVGGRRWTGQGPFPLNRWTRLLLLQQLLVEAIDLLDPAHVRVPANRRVVLAPVSFREAPELEAYRARMREMSQVESPLQMQQSAAAAAAASPLGRLRTWLQGLTAQQLAGAGAGGAAVPASLSSSGVAGDGIYTPDLVSTAAAAAALGAAGNGAGAAAGQQQQQQQRDTVVVVVAPGSGSASNGGNGVVR
ncbi:hypothetical protein HXX76_007409 [Chlamydomonas incerta]|uniref:Uncharacterized protein n=1 Tax=Chlamydomonas incerta TaxID=51695 RepID=A0A835TC97_CHLIN|nr:hypothetical protein HXX76_007409 [Chlamydomonas incerta]|eukprot:KAG2435335.1 hypothetical protein HXX76_007409 [Chlamydomonas incerta]